jgi:hypothetical protein
MKKLLLLSSLALAIFSTSANAQSNDGKAYGTSFNTEAAMSTARIPVLLKDKDKVEDVKISGYVSKVCQKEGCWMVMRTEKNTNDDVMVRMKDHAFVIPKDVAGKNAVVKGTVVKKTQSVAEQKHYLEDEGASKEEIAKITTPKDTYEMQVTGVFLYN